MKFKFYIKMDEEAMLAAPGRNYDMTLMNQALDKILARGGFSRNPEVTDGIEYVGGTSFPWSARVMWDLEAQQWFLPYCKKWLWYVDEEDDGNWEIYDKLERLRERGEL